MTTNNTINSAIRRGGPAAVGRDTRGVSEVLGAILIFALVLMLIVLFQVTLVPSLNKAAEFDHSERVQGDMEALQANLLTASATGAPADMTVETGVRYPERAFLLNPPPVAGEFSTHPGSITLDGFSSTDPETADFWNGSAMAPYETRTLSYVVEYNEYRTPPRTVYEYSTLYNRFGDDTVLPLGNGKLISGNRISLVVLEGDISAASTRSLTSTLDPVSAPATTTVLSGDGVDPTITLTSTLSEEKWEAILAEEMNETVKSVSKSGDVVTITLFANEPYKVRMTKIGIGSGYDATQRPAYIRTIDGHNATIGPSEKHQIVFEVLDEFNNPVPGVAVNASASAEGSVAPMQTRTDIDGRAVFEFTAGGAESGPVDVVGSFSDGSTATETATATITVSSGTNGGGDSDGMGNLDFNPARIGEDVILDGTVRNAKEMIVSMTLNNTIDTPQSIESVRINFLFAGQPTDNDIPYTFELYHDESQVLDTHPIGFDFAELDGNVLIPANDPETILDVRFNDLSSSAHDVFFVMSIVYEDQGTGERTTRVYLVPAVKN